MKITSIAWPEKAGARKSAGSTFVRVLSPHSRPIRSAISSPACPPRSECDPLTQKNAATAMSTTTIPATCQLPTARANSHRAPLSMESGAFRPKQYRPATPTARRLRGPGPSPSGVSSGSPSRRGKSGPARSGCRRRLHCPSLVPTGVFEPRFGLELLGVPASWVYAQSRRGRASLIRPDRTSSRRSMARGRRGTACRRDAPGPR